MYLGGNRRWVPLYHCSFSEGDLVEQTKIALSAINLVLSGPFFLYCQIISRVTMAYSIIKSVFRGPSDLYFKVKKTALYTRSTCLTLKRNSWVISGEGCVF